MGYSVKIDAEKCIGCGKCIMICPKDVIDMVDDKAVAARPGDCDGLAACMRLCPEGALVIRSVGA